MNIVKESIDDVADAILHIEDSLFVIEPQRAMFYYFKPTGKYYTEGKGYIPMFHGTWTREELLLVNNNKMPGLSTKGETFRIVVVPEIESVFGWPQILEPSEYIN